MRAQADARSREGGRSVPPYESHLMRILIVKLSSIGDVVHTLPAAALLRRALPDARITWVAGASRQPHHRGFTGNRRSDHARYAWLAQKPSSAFSNCSIYAADGLNRLRKVPELNGAAGADIAIDFQGLIKSGIIAFASRASTRSDSRPAILRETASKLLLTEQGELHNSSTLSIRIWRSHEWLLRSLTVKTPIMRQSQITDMNSRLLSRPKTSAMSKR